MPASSERFGRSTNLRCLHIDGSLKSPQMGGTVQNSSLRTGCSLDCLKYIVLAQCIMMRNGWCGLDWFTPHSFADGMVVAQSLRNSNVDLDIEQVSQGKLDGSVKGVPVTFLQYQYPLLRPLEQWNEMSCPLASLEDLACMKLSAIAQRGARKDFCDIYALGKKAFSLSQMLNFYQKNFSIRDIGSVLYGLVYFDDAESERMPRMLLDVKWKEIRNIILGWVKEIS